MFVCFCFVLFLALFGAHARVRVCQSAKADVTKLKFAIGTIAKLRKERLRKVKVVSMKVSFVGTVCAMGSAPPSQPDDATPEFWHALGASGPADVPADVPNEKEWEALYDAQCRCDVQLRFVSCLLAQKRTKTRADFTNPTRTWDWCLSPS